MRYIDADELDKALAKECNECMHDEHDCEVCNFAIARLYVKAAPTIEAKPMHENSEKGNPESEAYCFDCIHNEVCQYYPHDGCDFKEKAESVKHGRWIPSDDKNWLTCSSCGADVDVSCGAPFFYVDNDEVSHINFCPNCGYKQDLEDGDING